MKYFPIFLSLTVALSSSSSLFAQQRVSDGTTVAMPIDPDAVLELQTNNKGILLPRVALTATNTPAPLSAHVAGMLVYNTATAGTAPNNVTPGQYYNDGTQWLRILHSGNLATAWYNQGTTTDALGSKTTSIERRGSFAVGTNCFTPSGVLTIGLAVGSNDTASGYGSIAVGGSSAAKATSSVAMGGGAKATGNNSIALGQGVVAAGLASVALGSNSKALGHYVGVFGVDNVAYGTGYGAWAVGDSNIVNGDRSIAIGNNNNIAGAFASALGSNASIAANGKHSLGIGLSDSSWTAPLNQPNTMVIMGGKVGIDKVDPKSKLAVTGLPVYADNTAATTGGLTVGDFYRTATGQVMVVF